ncbi:putative general amino acid permease [Massarina eburnea CBS 473.64]|uniref:Putative general amino acid permease n=1 Tax=Massarina eburnea CBS 473.64 TaxID=1395130 RepID=A0A6A6RQD6_9PLEO|nr:putative general amino acid permease [Massarina eburnea CBS 473.64]
MTLDIEKKVQAVDVDDVRSGEVQDVSSGTAHLQRRLGGKEVQLFAIGGAIGTSIFVTMGTYLPKSGPAGLLIGYTLWCMNVWCVNECFAEMSIYAPVPSSFITTTSYWVDEALAFAQSWAFFLCQAFLVPAEITALHILLTFWTDKMPVEATVLIVLAIYGVLNCIDTALFGKAEFWLSIAKVFLVFLFFAFTFFTMVGWNPLGDAYGFRYWNNPGAFSEYLTTGSLGAFWGTISVMTFASFSVCGPEYISSVVGETKSPRRILPSCFASFKYRMLIFFVGSALCIGIVVPYNDPSLAAFIAGSATGSGTSKASPYVIAMERMNIPGLPHLVNAIMITSLLSCGNGVLFAASRALFVMGQAGRAPGIFGRTTKRGIPIYSVAMCLLLGLLALMGLSDTAFTVLKYFIDLCTVCAQFNYMCVCITYMHFYWNLEAKGIDRDTLPYKARFQPYASYVGAVAAVVAMVALGFDVVAPLDVKWFFIDYTLLGVFPVMYGVVKVVKKTKYVRVGTADLGLGGMVKEVDDYEDVVVHEPEGGVERLFSGLWEWGDLVRWMRRLKVED